MTATAFDVSATTGNYTGHNAAAAEKDCNYRETIGFHRQKVNREMRIDYNW